MMIGAPRQPYFPDSPDLGLGVTAPVMPPVTAHPSFFGQGGTGRSIAGAIGDALLAMNHQDAIYGPAMRRQQEAQSELEKGNERVRMEHQLSRDDYLWKQEHPDPVAKDEFTRYMDAANIPEEQRQPLYRQRLDSIANPGKWVMNPQTGQWMNVGAPPSQPRTFDTLPADAVPLGGPTPPASGTFRW